MAKKRKQSSRVVAAPASNNNNDDDKKQKTPKHAADNKKKKTLQEESSMNGGDEDWISSLAKQVSSTDIPTKQQRLEKRAAKKARREAKRAFSSPGGEQIEIDNRRNINSKAGKQQSSHNVLTEQKQKQIAILTKQRIVILKRFLHALSQASSAQQKVGRPRPYQGINIKVKKRKANWEQTLIQPRNSDYGGIGLARESLYLSFHDPAFFPKLEEEFKEHIPGFFGRTHTKAMKRQLGKNMLWRQLADKKKSNVKVNGKKLSDMTPDERVQAMIDNGML
jgi:hypothetical protein